MASEPADIIDPLPDPPKQGAQGGITGVFSSTWSKTKQVAQDTGNRLSEVSQKVSNNPTMQKTASVIKTGAIKTGQKIGEISQKGWHKANENERFADAVQNVSEFSQRQYETTKSLAMQARQSTTEFAGKMGEKSKEISGKVSTKTYEITNKVKEKAEPMVEKGRLMYGVTREKGGQIWEAGGGMITKVRVSINEGGFKGNAKETLLARQEAVKKWEAIRIRGAEEVQVARRREYTTNYFVEKGTLVRWSFRVRDCDIGFGVRIRIMQDGGSREEDILGVERFDNTDTIEGSWMADEDRTIVLVFDNTYSLLRSKHIAFLVGVEPPRPITDSTNLHIPRNSDVQEEKAEL